MKLNPHRQKARLAVLTLGKGVRQLDLIGKHLALHRYCGKQRDHRVRGPDFILDLTRPIHSHREMPVREDPVPMARQFFFQSTHDLFVGLSIAPVEQHDLEFSCLRFRLRSRFSHAAAGMHG